MSSYSIDREIDLMPIMMGVLRRWYWIVLAAIIGGVVASGLALRAPSYYDATASVIFLGDRTRLTLDSRLVTENSTLSNYVWRRQALVKLVTSKEIEAQLPPDLIEQLAPSDYKVGQLADLMSASDEGDLLWITARASSPEEAQLLANVWSEGYVSYINDLFSSSNSSTLTASQQQVEQARATYEEVNQAYVEYLANHELDAINDQINSLFNLLDGNRRANASFYQYQLIRANNLSLILQDAQALRAQITSASTVGPSEKLALLLLRARAVGPEVHPLALGNPANNNNEQQSILAQPLLQVQIGDSATIEASQAEVLADLDRLMASVEEQVASLNASLDKSVDALAGNEPVGQSNWTVEEQQAQYKRLTEFRAQREDMEGQKDALEQAREIALEKLQVVERQLAEQEVLNNQNSNNQLRLASSAPLPTSPISRGIISRFIIGTMSGAVFGTFLAVLAAIQLPAIFRRVSTPVARPS
ncbi:MAG: hypothetical protein ACPGWR_04060 [Ardenticatenaceae bacterium]